MAKKKAAKKKTVKKRKAEAQPEVRKFQPTMAAHGNHDYIIELVDWCKRRLKTWAVGVGASGTPTKCPVCKKPDALRYGASGYNGHIWIKCRTKGCIDGGE